MKIKIAFLMQQVIVGGIETCLVSILDKLKEFPEYDITVISRTPVTERRFLDFFEKNNIKLIDGDLFKYTSMDRPEKFLPRKLWRLQCIHEKRGLRKLMNSYDILVDYFNGSFYHVIRKSKTPSILFIHSCFDAYTKDGYYVRHLSAYDKIVSISKSFHDDIVSRHPEYADKFCFIYNPIDIHKIRERADNADTPTDTAPYFISLARLHKDKDHATLLFGFLLFLRAENWPDVKLYLCGAGPLRERLEQLVRNIGLDKYVVFTGALNNPFGYTRGAMAHILSSFGEGLGNALVEAQALETINIASNVKSGVAEVLMDGSAGLLFPCEDAPALAAHMSDVYHKRIDIKKYIDAGTENLGRFDSRKIVQELDKLFKNTLTPKGAHNET